MFRILCYYNLKLYRTVIHYRSEQPFPCTSACDHFLSPLYYSSTNTLRENSSHYFFNANIFRIVPSDLGPSTQKHVYYLLFLVSFSDIIFGNSCSAADSFFKSLNICHYSNLLQIDNPVYTLLSTNDGSKAITNSFNYVNFISQIPKIQHVPHSQTLSACDSIFFGKTTQLCEYDAFSHIFVNISRESCWSNTFDNPKFKIRKVDGTFNANMDANDIFQGFLTLMLNYEIPQMFVPRFDITNQLIENREFITDSYSGTFHLMLNSDLHLYLLEVLHCFCPINSKTFIDLHYSICRHALKCGKVSLLRNTRHFAGLIWWVLIGEMEEVGGLESVYDWCENSQAYKTAEYIAEIRFILSEYEKKGSRIH